MKKKKSHTKLPELFEKDAIFVEKALKASSEAVIAACEHRPEDSKKFIQKTIELEAEQDIVRDKIIERLFSKETMVFSRADRLQLVREMNRIVSFAERVARRLSLHNPTPNEEILHGLSEISGKTADIGVLLKDLIIAVLDDFQKAEILINKIGDMREEIRDKEYDLLKVLYKVGDEIPTKQDFVFWEDLITNSARIANYADQIADKIYGLICKYTM